MSLCALILRVLGATSITMFSDSDSSRCLTLREIQYLAAKNASTFAFHMASCPLLKTDYVVCGGVKSGHLGTSWADSMYTMVLMELYLVRKEEFLLRSNSKYYDHFKMAREAHLIQIWVYGDDFMGRFPKNLWEEGILTARGFTDMCVNEFGMKLKWIKGENGEYETPFSSVTYEYVDGIWKLTEEILTIDFLKNFAAKVFHIINGVKYFIGIYAYRPFWDLMGKTLASKSALCHPTLWAASLISLGYLSQGNTEAYYYLRRMFFYLEKFNHNLKSELESYVNTIEGDRSQLKDLPHSLRKLILSGGIDLTEFPSLSKIRTEASRNVEFLPKQYKDWDGKKSKAIKRLDFWKFDVSQIINRIATQKLLFT